MKQAFFVYGSDEDYGILGFCCAIPVEKEHETFKEAIEDLMPVLSSDEFVQKLIHDDCLEDTHGKLEFVSCGYRNYSLEYLFRLLGDTEDGEMGDEITVSKRMHFIDLF